VEKVHGFYPEKGVIDEEDINDLINWVNTTFPLGLTREKVQFEKMSELETSQHLIKLVTETYEVKERHEDPAGLKYLERYTILSAIDRLWQGHLYEMDGLRTGIDLRRYAQKDPLIEYKNEAFQVFSDMWGNVKVEIVGNIFRSASSLMAFEKFLTMLPQKLVHQQLEAFSPTIGQDEQSEPAPAQPSNPEDAVSDILKAMPVRREGRKIQRNDSCPHGKCNAEGKVLKFKNCCGREGVDYCKLG